MEKEYLLFIDSGLGGFSTLKTALSYVNCNYLYYADNLNAPYGNLTNTQLYNVLHNIIVQMTKKYNIKVIVLACNTATTSSIKKLRENFPNINFIGTEPAIKLANNLGYNNIACIATPATLRQQNYINLINGIPSKIKSIPLKNFAKQIETYLVNQTKENYFQIIKSIFKIKSQINNFDCLVLGCTHYALLSNILKMYISIPMVDGNLGVCKMLSKYVNTTQKSTIKIILSKNKNQLKQKYIKILKQTLAKE